MIFPYTFLALGFPPVIGNLFAARGLTSYAAQVHPDWIPDGGWAGYDLVDGYYWLPFTDGTQSHELGYADGTVRDEERESALRTELNIDKALRINGLQNSDGYYVRWNAHWSAKDHNQPLISVLVDFYDSSDAPIPDETDMRKKMADRAMEVYEVLAPAASIHTFSVGYCHQGIHGKNPGNVWHIVQTNLPEGTSLTRNHILSGNLTVK